MGGKPFTGGILRITYEDNGRYLNIYRKRGDNREQVGFPPCEIDVVPGDRLQFYNSYRPSLWIEVDGERHYIGCGVKEVDITDHLPTIHTGGIGEGLYCP